MKTGYNILQIINLKNKESCCNCFYYKSGNCNGISKVCVDYSKVPEITNDEMARWRKFGDATRIRQRRIKIYG